MSGIPRIISVDDHVIEPPDLWSSRLPKKFLDRGPRIVRERGRFGLKAGGGFGWVAADDGEVGDIWYYDDVAVPLMKTMAAVSYPDEARELATVATFDQLRPRCWKQKARLEYMAANLMDASICTHPRYCGSTNMEREHK